MGITTLSWMAYFRFEAKIMILFPWVITVLTLQIIATHYIFDQGRHPEQHGCIRSIIFDAGF